MNTNVLLGIILLLALALAILLVEVIRIRIRVKWHDNKIKRDDERDTTLQERVVKLSGCLSELTATVGTERAFLTAIAADVVDVTRNVTGSPSWVSSEIVCRDVPAVKRYSVKSILNDTLPLFQSCQTFHEFMLVCVYVQADLYNRTLQRHELELPAPLIEITSILGGPADEFTALEARRTADEISKCFDRIRPEHAAIVLAAITFKEKA